MTANDQTILLDFQTESKALIKKMTLILEKCECGISQVQRLEEYGQAADRIMGAAKSVSSTLAKPMRVLGALGDYAALCEPL